MGKLTVATILEASSLNAEQMRRFAETCEMARHAMVTFTTALDEMGNSHTVIHALDSCNRGTRSASFTAAYFDELVDRNPPLMEEELDPRIPGLIAQWNRAKVQRNKNLMRDLEQRIKCIRGY